jgi:hypothetical protein
VLLEVLVEEELVAEVFLEDLLQHQELLLLVVAVVDLKEMQLLPAETVVPES